MKFKVLGCFGGNVPGLGMTSFLINGAVCLDAGWLVDSLTLESPLLVPAFANASIVPGPNRFRTLDLPIVQAGVIEGRVVRADRDLRGAGGVTLILTERRTGARRTLVTFSDGDFYLLGVKPGDYDLTVDQRVLDALGLTADPVRLTLTPGVEGVGQSGIQVVLKPRS